MWRQGDVLIQEVEAIPKHAIKQKRLVVASGDRDGAGHRHVIKDQRSASLYSAIRRDGTELFLEVTKEEARLVHPEHDPIVLPRGLYRVWRQREFHDVAPRPILD